MIDLQAVSDLIYDFFEKVSVSGNGTHFHARCALCGDSKKSKSKKRFHMDYNGGNPIYHCFNCDRSGSFLQLYSMLHGISVEEAYNIFQKFDVENLTRQLSPKKVEKVITEIEYENHNWILDDCLTRWSNPDGIIQLKYLTELKSFIKKRKIPDEYHIYIAYKGEYKSRIIIPVFDVNKDIIYFQARRIPGTDIEPKYKNPTMTKGDIILNKFRFDPDKYIIITEGLMNFLMKYSL
jgi:hypothetical protein